MPLRRCAGCSKLRGCEMAEAEIIPFGSRGPRGRAGSAGPEATPQEAPTLGDQGFESEEVPPTPTLGALLGELVRLGSRSLRPKGSIQRASSRSADRKEGQGGSRPAPVCWSDGSCRSRSPTSRRPVRDPARPPAGNPTGRSPGRRPALVQPHENRRRPSPREPRRRGVRRRFRRHQRRITWTRARMRRRGKCLDPTDRLRRSSRSTR